MVRVDRWPRRSLPYPAIDRRFTDNDKFGAGVVVYTLWKMQFYVLCLLKRGSQHLDMPEGRRRIFANRNEESEKATAERELYEESGISIDLIRYFPDGTEYRKQYFYNSRRCGALVSKQVTLFACIVDPGVAIKVNKREHERYAWRPAGEMCSASSHHYVDVIEHFNSIILRSVDNLFNLISRADVASRDRTLCLGCLEDVAEMAAIHRSDGSGHLTYCRTCLGGQGNMTALVGFGCPLCRQPITGFVRIFG